MSVLGTVDSCTKNTEQITHKQLRSRAMFEARLSPAV